MVELMILFLFLGAWIAVAIVLNAILPWDK